jgi:hypothetical protein
VPAKRNLSKTIGGADFPKAVAALAALRQLDPGERRTHIPAVHAQDEQRALQIRVAELIAEGGVQAVAAAWRELPSAEWRTNLITEIDQAFLDWIDEGTFELLVAALEDPEISVSRRALGTLRAYVAPLTAKERKGFAKTKRGTAYLEARDRAAAWITAARRARMTRAVIAILRGYPENRPSLFWPDKFVELLGHTATRDDEEALSLLEGLRPLAGEPHRCETTTLDPYNLPWPTSILAQRKGIPVGTPMKHVSVISTGLLDLKNLESAIARIRARPGSGQ